MPDPSKLLSKDTISLLRDALATQRTAPEREIVPQLVVAVQTAAREARDRSLPSEALVIQLRALADEVGIPQVSPTQPTRNYVREWVVTAMLEAYWKSDTPD